MSQPLTSDRRKAQEFASADDVRMAFEASTLNRDSISAVWEGPLSRRANVFGPLGSWIGYLTALPPQAKEETHD